MSSVVYYRLEDRVTKNWTIIRVKPLIVSVTFSFENYLVIGQEWMPCARTHHILISVEHASHRLTNPERQKCHSTIIDEMK